MIKTVLKETFIMILLSAALSLVLAIIFYDYIPINKDVPKPAVYTMPEELSEVKEELNNTLDMSKEEDPIITYTIEDEDIEGFKRTNSYSAGKANPFEEYAEEPAENTQSEETKESQNDNSKSTTKKSTSTTGTLFEKGNTK